MSGRMIAGTVGIELSFSSRTRINSRGDSWGGDGIWRLKKFLYGCASTVYPPGLADVIPGAWLNAARVDGAAASFRQDSSCGQTRRFGLPGGANLNGPRRLPESGPSGEMLNNHWTPFEGGEAAPLPAPLPKSAGGEALCARMTMSTRRFTARPSGVLLSAAGWYSA